MPNIRGKTWTEGDFFTPTDAQFFEDHLYDGGGGGGGASWGAISGNIQNQTDLIDYIDEHSGGSASWGSITGTIENQTDLVEYIATHGGGGGGAAWGSIAGNIQNQTDLVTNFAQKNQLSTVATSGSYNDLTNKPTLSTVASSGSYNDLSSKPTLAAVATSGSYHDLSNKPTLAAVASSGSYNDLIDKPEGGSVWGEITGNIESQTDLIDYIASHGGGGGGFNATLLWTNSTVTSAFNNTTLSIDTNYTMFIVVLRARTGDDTHKANLCFKGVKNGCMVWDNTGWNECMRIFNFGNGNVSISGGYLANPSFGNSSNPDNTAAIPYQIYGIK